jgi:hypothetical protein
MPFYNHSFLNFRDFLSSQEHLFHQVGNLSTCLVDLLKYYDYLYLEISKDYVYKNCCLVNEIDDYLKNFNFERVETKWTTQNWGMASMLKKIYYNKFSFMLKI